MCTNCENNAGVRAFERQRGREGGRKETLEFYENVLYQCRMFARDFSATHILYTNTRHTSYSLVVFLFAHIRIHTYTHWTYA